MADRVQCAVPFCRITGHADEYASDMLCQKHYNLSDKKYRKLFRRSLRRDAYGVVQMVWSRIKRQAIERATGI